MVGIVVVNHNSIVGLGKAKLTTGNSDDADVVWGACSLAPLCPLAWQALGLVLMMSISGSWHLKDPSPIPPCAGKA